MLDIQSYIKFCRRFHNYKIPKVKFKEINERYKLIYRRDFKIEEEDINKATFIVFLISFSIIFLNTIILLKLNFMISISVSFFLALIFSYIFSLKLYKILHKKEMKLSALLYIIKIYFSLLQKSLPLNSDYALIFIRLIKDYKLSISKTFKLITKKIQEGENPEEELINVVTPSQDFNNYLNELLIKNFENITISNENYENSIEKQFKIYLRQIETRISIVFFVGLFFPLGLSFLVLFQRINSYFLFLFIAFFFLLQRFLYRKFLRSDIFLLGLLNDYTKKEKRKFDEFISFLKSFAINLKKNISPEKAFLYSYSYNRNQLKQIRLPIQNQINNLLNFSYSFNEVLDQLKLELNSFRYNIIVEMIKKLIIKNAFESSEKIIDILNIISKHKKLERKLEIIVKGEKFKVLVFLFLLPIIMGAIGGMFPLFVLIIENVDFDINIDNQNLLNFMINGEIIILFISLLISVLISSNYFLKIIKYERRHLLVVLSIITYILIFFTSSFNMINFL